MAAVRACLRRLAIVVTLGTGTIIADHHASVAASADALIAALTPTRSDRSSVETTFAPDGHAKVTVRGESYDGRRLLEAVFSALSKSDPSSSPFDLDLDIKVATLKGFNGERLHNVAIKLSGRAGEILAFDLTSTLNGSDLRGDLRYDQRGQRILYLETKDAGALLRFVNIYRRMQSGDLRATMAVSSADRSPQDGTLTIQRFSVVGEQALQPLIPLQNKWVHKAPQRLGFSRLHLDLKWSLGLLEVNDGAIVGTILAATTSGKTDLAGNEVALRGVAVPLVMLPSRKRVIPQLLTEPGLIGVDYKLAGPLQSPVLQFSPMSLVAPGLLLKLFEFPPTRIEPKR
jgi:hypothetical protein